MDGYLLIDKPQGISSFGVVARVRGIIRAETGQKIKIGHTGTLDPAASGLMILVLGKYTKKAAEFSKLDKTYDVELTLGATSTTADSEGEIVKKSAREPSEDQIKEVLNTFVGEISQVPPIYSAIKVNGQRAYKLARKGQEVVIEPRKITINSIENVVYKYPKLAFTASVSSGTYIRSLAVDVGKDLGVGAYLSNLRRLTVGKYDVKDALTGKELNLDLIQNNLQK